MNKNEHKFKYEIPILFAVLVSCYLVGYIRNPEYMLPIVAVAFPVMLVVVGVIWFREKATSVSLDEAVRDLRLAKVRLKEGYFSTMRSLALAIEAKDPYTRGHSARVVKYALLIAREMRLSEEERTVIRNAGVLHDIGKIAIADHVLGKPGKLSDDEFESIKKHPALGVDILKPLPFLKGELSIILEHHERVDGGGYHRLPETEIPLASRIIAVADSYDAMTSDRPYRKAYPRDKAVQELKEHAGSQFDEEVVDAFLKALEHEESSAESEAGSAVEVEEPAQS